MTQTARPDPSPFAVYKRLWGYTRKYVFMFVFGMLGVSLDAAMQAVFIRFVEPLIDRVFVAKDAAFGLWLAVAILVVVLLRIVGHFCGNYGMEWTGRRVVADLRRELFASYLHMPSVFFDRHSAGQLISRLAYNSEQVAQAATRAVIAAFRDVMLLLYLLIVMLSLNARLTAVMLVLVPAIALVVTVISRKFRKISRNIQDSMGAIAHVTEEAVVGERVVKVFLGQKTEQRRFDRVNEHTRRQHMRMVVMHMLGSSLVQLAAGLALVALILIAIRPSMLAQITAGTFTSLFFAMVATIPPLKRLTTVQSQLQKGIAAAESIFSVIDSEREDGDTAGAVEPVRGDIEFRDVSFRYDNQERPVLAHVDLRLRPGSVTAVVGKSGSGKTTLAGMLPRFYDYSVGRILLDGRELKEYGLAALRRQIALVGQEVVLFNDTIAANIAYGELAGADRESILRAARAAHAMEFIEQLPDGIDTRLGGDGTSLSGGQRQRLAIARALLKNAPILILDEATSALDSESERAVQAALNAVMKDRTTLVIAHRLSTIENADLVVVLERGSVIETGTHETLLARGGAYAQLYQTQFDDVT